MADCNADALDMTLGWRSAEKCASDLEQLYDEHSESLFRYALAITGSTEDAEDAVQDVFARVIRSNPSLRNVDNVRAYLLASARNAAFSLLRTRRRRNEDMFAGDAEIESSADTRETPADTLVLREAFESLPAEQREVILLKVYEGMTFSEISQAVDAPLGTITSRYRYALSRLRAALEEEADGR
ncbi:MAG: sigma-70 family RNA polymerase sigma factor [Armatimonadota bacterium]|nr:sigma-70 family RNA polymerase sigma factor [Armatimonadota bacterium]